MTTPLIILAILLIPLVADALSASIRKRPRNPQLAGTFGLAMAFIFFGIGHFALTAQMVEMLPPWVPARQLLVYASGLLEFSLGLGLLMPRFRVISGWVCLAVLVGFFPINVYSAINHIGMGGHSWGPIYLWIRAPLQLVLISWTYYFVVRRARLPGLGPDSAQP